MEVLACVGGCDGLWISAEAADLQLPAHGAKAAKSVTGALAVSMSSKARVASQPRDGVAKTSNKTSC